MLLIFHHFPAVFLVCCESGRECALSGRAAYLGFVTTILRSSSIFTDMYTHHLLSKNIFIIEMDNEDDSHTTHYDNPHSAELFLDPEGTPGYKSGTTTSLGVVV